MYGNHTINIWSHFHQDHSLKKASYIKLLFKPTISTWNIIRVSSGILFSTGIILLFSILRIKQQSKNQSKIVIICHLAFDRSHQASWETYAAPNEAQPHTMSCAGWWEWHIVCLIWTEVTAGRASAKIMWMKETTIIASLRDLWPNNRKNKGLGKPP